MGTGKPKVTSFIVPFPFEEDAMLDTQIKNKIIEHLNDNIRLSYQNTDQKEMIANNIGIIVKTLRIMEKHWCKLFSKEFPDIPEKIPRL